MIKIHYNGWSKTYDEWMFDDDPRLNPNKTKVKEPEKEAPKTPPPPPVIKVTPKLPKVPKVVAQTKLKGKANRLKQKLDLIKSKNAKNSGKLN